MVRAITLCLLIESAIASRPIWASQTALQADVIQKPPLHSLMVQKQQAKEDSAASVGNSSSVEGIETPPSSDQEAAARKAFRTAQLRLTHAAQKKAFFEEQLRGISAEIASGREASSQLGTNLKAWTADKDSALEELKQLKDAGMEALRSIKTTQMQAQEAGQTARDKAKTDSLLALQSASLRRVGEEEAGDKRQHGLDPETELQGTTVLVEDGAAALEVRLQRLLGRIAAGEKAKEQLDAHLKDLASKQTAAEEKLKKANDELKHAEDDLEAVTQGRTPRSRSVVRHISSHTRNSRLSSPLADFDASLKPFGP
mmetsp:Transcript_58743/g.137108  ORF Transcript_58743/g.137108 Transcript_58743/m.137108 type:complete len:314 (+) Transcript_58743:132-1073(+)